MFNSKQKMSTVRKVGMASGVLVALGTAVATAQVVLDANTQVIHACADTKSGALRIVANATECKSNETPVSWNQEGPQGPVGPPGPEGPEGPAGPADPGSVAAAVECETGAITEEVFLKVDGVQGESVHSKHLNEIEVRAFGWRIDHPSGQTAAKVGPLCIGKHFDRASPQLMNLNAAGESVPQVVLTFDNASGQQYLRYTLHDVRVITNHVLGVGDSNPYEKVIFVYSEIDVEYRAQKPDGSLDAPVVFHYAAN